MKKLQAFQKHFSNGNTALAVRVTGDADPVEIARNLQLPPAKSLLLVFGGAAKMSETASRQVNASFKALAQTLTRLHPTVMDGGTDSGVMKLLGSALAEAGHRAPYIGVLPALTKLNSSGTFGEEGFLTAADILEPHHTHFVLLEEDGWGKEIKLMDAHAGFLSADIPSLALLVNGGEIALREVQQSIESGREVLVLKGSGRLADEIAGTLTSPVPKEDKRFITLQQSGRQTIFDVTDPPEKLSALLTNRLTRE